MGFRPFFDLAHFSLREILTMNNPFSQPKVICKLYFKTFYKYLENFEILFSGEEVLGISSFEVESRTIEAEPEDIWQIEIYLDKPVRPDFVEDIKSHSLAENLEIIGNIGWEKVEDKDWVAEYHSQLAPINIGSFFISTTAHSNQRPADKLPILLEASRAFGTGEHETTSGCIKLLESLAGKKISAILDIGTGSGILSFAASKLWSEAKILACDIDEVSVEVANFNQSFNGSKIHFYQNSLDSLMIPPDFGDQFDIIVSNILAKPLIDLAEDIRKLVKPDGKVIISGFLDYQVAEIARAYEKVNLVLEKKIDDKDWNALLLRVNNG